MRLARPTPPTTPVPVREAVADLVAHRHRRIALVGNRAKGMERGGFALFDPSMHEGSMAQLRTTQLRTESELRQAIGHGQLDAFSQPTAHRDSGRVHALESTEGVETSQHREILQDLGCRYRNGS